MVLKTTYLFDIN